MVSSKPSKQRLILYNLSSHQRKKLLIARVSEDLEKEYGIRRIPIHVGDVVRILRGDYKGSEGKVTKVDRKSGRIMVEGISRKRSDGTDIFIKIHASKVMIIKLDTTDSRRMESIKKKAELRRNYFEKLKSSKGV